MLKDDRANGIFKKFRSLIFPFFQMSARTVATVGAAANPTLAQVNLLAIITYFLISFDSNT